MKYWKNLRVGEVFLMTGLSVVASFFAVEKWTAWQLGLVFIDFMAIFLLFISIYAANSWYGYRHDLYNPRLHFVSEIHRSFFLKVFILTFAGSLGIFYFLGKSLIVLSFITFLLWVLYSHEKYGLKKWPLTGTLLHFVCQILHYHLTHLVLRPYSSHSLSLSIYFALLFSAGHLHHENIDHNADKHSSIKTTTVYLGQKMGMVMTHLLFLMAAFYWIFLYSMGKVSEKALVPFLMAFLLQMILAYRLKEKLEQEKFKILYRSWYRIFYLMAGASFFAWKFSF